MTESRASFFVKVSAVNDDEVKLPTFRQRTSSVMAKTTVKEFLLDLFEKFFIVCDYQDC
jgi:hypothetical protein